LIPNDLIGPASGFADLEFAYDDSEKRMHDIRISNIFQDKEWQNKYSKDYLNPVRFACIRLFFRNVQKCLHNLLKQ
jgi:hypothetical protein